MKVVILAGGMGTRIGEESIYRPKPMVEIGGGMPILWHIMKGYSYYGFNDFIICAGYKQEYIKEWFDNYFLRSSDLTYDFSSGRDPAIHHSRAEPWRVTIADTGLDTMTGGRVKRIREYVGDEPFMLTYGDAVCDVDIAGLVKFHEGHGRTATVTAVIQKQEKGVLDINEIGAVRAFREKRAADGTPINAGYMVLQPEIFRYLAGDGTVLEEVALGQLAAEGELMSYKHTGFWQCMDSVRERDILAKIWETGNAPWKKWQ